jgi:arginine N-succinyltransferase
VTAATDAIRTIRESTTETVCGIGDGGKMRMLLATGRLTDFLAAFASVKRVPREGICIDPEAAELLGVKVGDQLLAASR